MAKIHVWLLIIIVLASCLSFYFHQAAKALLVDYLKVFAFESLQLFSRVGSNRFSQLPESHDFSEIQVLVLVVLNNPGKHRVLCQIVKRSVSYKIEVEQIVTVAEHSPLPRVLVIFHFVKQVVIDIWTHLNQSIDDSLGVL